MTTADERARQAEMDAARAREIVEERREREEQERDRADLAKLPGFHGAYVRTAAKAVREYVRAVLVMPAVYRLHQIGHGLTKHDVMGPDGLVLSLEAPAAVQRAALNDLIAIGIPRQMGLVDGQDGELPGVIALGHADLDEARRIAHGERYVSPETHAANMAQHLGVTGPSEAIPLRPMHERISAGEFELVEEDATPAATDQHPGEEATPPEVDMRPNPRAEKARAILANRQRRKRNGNGKHPSLTDGPVDD